MVKNKNPGRSKLQQAVSIGSLKKMKVTMDKQMLANISPDGVAGVLRLSRKSRRLGLKVY